MALATSSPLGSTLAVVAECRAPAMAFARRGYADDAAALPWVPPPPDASTRMTVSVSALRTFAVLLLVATLLALYVRRRERAHRQPLVATPEAGQRPCTRDCSPCGLDGSKVHKEPRVAGSAERAAASSSFEHPAADRAECAAAKESVVATLGLSLGSALGSALSPTLRLLGESEAATSACRVEDAAAGGPTQPAFTPLQQRVADAAPLLARAVGSVLASHALLPLQPLRENVDSESFLFAAGGAKPPASFAVEDGRSFVACFCRSFETSAWRCHDVPLADSPGGNDTDDAAQSADTLSLMTPQRGESWLPTSASALVAHLGAVAAGAVDATPAQIAAIQAMISLECTDIARQHLGTARMAASAAVRGAASVEDSAEIAAARLRDAALQRVAGDALACAVLVAAASLASRVRAVAFALPMQVQQCAVNAGLSRHVFAAVLMPLSLADAVNCALAALVRSCGAAASLVGALVVVARLGASVPAHAAAAAAGPRVTALLFVSAALLWGGGAAAGALGGSAAVWGLTWAPLCACHVVLHAGVGAGIARRLERVSFAARAALWCLGAVAWPAVAAALPFCL